MHEALDIDTGNTIATIIVGIIAYIVVLVIVAAINGALGLGATGGDRRVQLTELSED